MGIIDWIILFLIVLAALVGFFKGFGHSSLKKWAFIIGIVLAYFIGVPAARGLMNLGIGDWLTEIYVGLIPSDGAFAESLAGLSAASQDALMAEALTEWGCPTFFQGFVTTNAVFVDGTVAYAISSSLAYWTFIGALFLLLAIICFAILNFLFKLIAEPILGKKGKGLIGRILGIVKHVAKSSFSILVIMLIVVLIDQIMLTFGNSAFHDWIDSDLSLNTSSFSLGRLFYDTAASMLSWISLI